MHHGNCVVTGEQFDIPSRLASYLKEHQLPLPTLSPQERSRRRICFRNERSLHKRQCDLTGKSIVSVYRPDIPHRIYSLEAWWGENSEALQYGRAFDFSRPFFSQFEELLIQSPLPATKIINSENCDYNYAILNSRNCYRSARIDRGEDILYSHLVLEGSKNCVDCFDMLSCELCYECIKCRHCYSCCYAELCESSHDLYCCYNLRGCSDCIGCTNLRQKRFHVFNQPVAETTYRELQQALRTSQQERTRVLNAFQDLKLQSPRRATVKVQVENCSGDFLFHSKNCDWCFDCAHIEDCQYLIASEFANNSVDGEFLYRSEQMHECLGPNASSRCFFCIDPSTCSDSFYSISCVTDCGHLFGCVGLKKKRYCILNKQYSKEEYERLLVKIIVHMRETKEWGEFFPAHLSPFPYNESVAQAYYPLTEQQVRARGLSWSSDINMGKVNQEQGSPADDNKHQLQDQSNSVIRCEISGRAFNIIPQEREFYRKFDLPLPRRHPDLRHQQRFAHLNPLTLYQRSCAKTGQPLETTYPPDSPFVIYHNDVFADEFER